MKFRRIVQLTIFTLFIWLIIRTADQKAMGWPVDLFVRIDPLAYLFTSLSLGTFITGFLLILPLIIGTILLGRFFCTWICPLGTCLDIWEWLSGKRKWLNPEKEDKKIAWWKSHSGKYLLLISLAIMAILGAQAIWVFDPLPLVTRSMALLIIPSFEYIIRGFFGLLYLIPGIGKASDPVYGFFQSHFLSFEQPVYQSIGLMFSIFIGILLLSLLTRRFWCRNLCPLGAMLGFLSKVNLGRLEVDENCTGCGLCKKICKMDAILKSPEKGGKTDCLNHGKGALLDYDPKECVWCMNCRDKCPTKSINMGLSFLPKNTGSNTDWTRRRVLISAGLGAVIAPLYSLNLTRKFPKVNVLRPPGAMPEEEFLDRCIRCGECMKICLRNALHPVGLESGLEGMLTPRLETRSTYCEHNCNLCGQVCPTGAIEFMSLSQKQQISMGVAYIDKNRCIPYAQGYDCIVCEEHCPTSEKAIITEPEIVKSADGRERQVRLLRVIEERCVGCGICENKCPVDGPAAIMVIPRNPQLKLSEVEKKVRARQMGIGAIGYGG